LAVELDVVGVDLTELDIDAWAASSPLEGADLSGGGVPDLNISAAFCRSAFPSPPLVVRKSGIGDVPKHRLTCENQ